MLNSLKREKLQNISTDCEKKKGVRANYDIKNKIPENNFCTSHTLTSNDRIVFSYQDNQYETSLKTILCVESSGN